MPKKSTTNIYFIVDESGSMETIKDVAVDGFNSQLDEIFSADKNVRVSVTTFSDKVKINNWVCTRDQVEKLSEKNYKPGGWTRMLDAVGTTLLLAEGEWNGNDQNLVIVISDGYENSSKEYTWDAVRKTIERLEGPHWTFAYIGANQNMWEIRRRTGIRNTMNWENTRVGTQEMYNTASATIGSRLRSGSHSNEIEGFDHN